jgi:CDP-glycerol glycerophosphotransferase (TagB/SpsB family)
MSKQIVIGFPYLEKGHRRCLVPVMEALVKKGYVVDEYYAHDVKNKPNTTLPRLKTHSLTVLNYLAVPNLYGRHIPRPIIFMSHGISVWKRGHNRHLADLHLIHHDWESRQMTTIFPYHSFNCRTVGFPKLDSLVKLLPHRREVKAKFIKEMKLDATKPIVAFLPTWGGDKLNIDEPEGTFFELEKIDVKKIPNFILSAHNTIGSGLTSDSHDGGVNARKATVFKKAPYVWVAPNKDKLLLSADVIVGDISSILIEGLVTDVPIIHLHRGSFAPFELNDAEGYNGMMFLGAVCSIERLQHTINEVLKNDDYKMLRKYWRDRFLKYSLDGKATERTVREIEKVLKEGLL